MLEWLTSPPLLDRDELHSEQKIFRRVVLLEKKSIMKLRNESVSPSMQDILGEIENSHMYGEIFPKIW